MVFSDFFDETYKNSTSVNFILKADTFELYLKKFTDIRAWAG